jgi:hypothetical protein
MRLWHCGTVAARTRREPNGPSTDICETDFRRSGPRCRLEAGDWSARTPRVDGCPTGPQSHPLHGLTAEMARTVKRRDGRTDEPTVSSHLVLAQRQQAQVNRSKTLNVTLLRVAPVVKRGYVGARFAFCDRAGAVKPSHSRNARATMRGGGRRSAGLEKSVCSAAYPSVARSAQFSPTRRISW